MRPLLIFGLRGTLVERIHVRRMPTGMPQPDLTVGLSKVWLRPDMLATLLALQPHCNMALWSSTTQRNTAPLVEAVFHTPRFFDGLAEASAAAHHADAAVPTVGESSPADSGTADGGRGAERGRFSRRRPPDATVDSASTQAAPAATPFKSPIDFRFVWSREHTRVDDFRRRNAVADDDTHATVKDLSLVFEQYPTIATPENTILIDDTPSKGKHHADNFLWLDSCEGLNVQDGKGMRELRRFVMEEACKTKDVRALLPRRIRRGN